MNRKILLASLAGAAALTVTVHADQAATGHYMPGSAASFIDAFPGVPGGLAAINYFTYYDGGVGSGRQLPLGGLLTTDTSATIYADTIAALYQTKCDVLGGGFAFGLAVPYVWLDIEGQAQRIAPDGTLGPVFNVNASANGIGDLTLIPFMLGWTNIMPDLKLDARLNIYAPTGEYEAGAPDNIGKNYWTFSPGIMASWLSTKIGTEISLYAGMDFNLENQDIDYTSGTALHFDLTVAQHLPLGKGIIGVGANAFYYQQISGDSGSYALLGDFEGMTVGVGPVISYIRPMGKSQMLAELKWLPELDVDNRMQGDYIWFKFGFLF